MENWAKMTMWVDKKLLKAHHFLPIFRMYDTHNTKIMGGSQKFDKQHINLYHKFVSKYPESLSGSSLSALEPENASLFTRSTGMRFVHKQMLYMREGFSEDKSFELVEKELSDVLQTEKYERSVFEGLATSNRARSLMSHYEQEAEFESRQKVKRMQAELPQFKRYQADIEKVYGELLAKDKDKKIENFDGEQDGLEDDIDPVYKNYEPVTCKRSINKR